jgi:hypothetical protein
MKSKIGVALTCGLMAALTAPALAQTGDGAREWLTTADGDRSE